MNVKKIANSRIIAILIIVFAVLVIFLFIYDVGINSKYFVRQDFNDAFLARQTGNCEKFKSYHLQEPNDWFDRCIEESEERKRDVPPIKSFTIREISIDGNRAFLQVELQRDTYSVAVQLAEKGHKVPEGGYLANYELTRVNGRWFFDQEVK